MEHDQPSMVSLKDLTRAYLPMQKTTQLKGIKSTINTQDDVKRVFNKVSALVNKPKCLPSSQ